MVRVPLARKLSGALESDLYDVLAPGAVLVFGATGSIGSLAVEETIREQDFDQHWRKCPNWEILGRAVRLSENVVDLQRVND